MGKEYKVTVTTNTEDFDRNDFNSRDFRTSASGQGFSLSAKYKEYTLMGYSKKYTLEGKVE